MSKKQLLQIGNPILRQKSAEIELDQISSHKTKKIIQNLKDSLDDRVAGLSAPQIGYNSKIFISNVRLHNKQELIVYINPEITNFSPAKEVKHEGCGSVLNTNLFGPVERSRRITIRALNISGNEFTKKLSGFYARVVQHEVDHLNGILFTDKLTDNTKLMSKKEYIKWKKEKKRVDKNNNL
jgi:peptide deformylase